MDKPLINKNNDNNVPTQDSGATASPAQGGTVLPANTPIGAYGSQTTRPLITLQAWSEIDPHKPWADDPKSRMAIRMFSRGILGAAFFAAGGLLAKKWMVGYDASKGLSDQTQKNPLTFIAKLIDTVVGKPIEATVTAIAGKEAGMSAVRFRPTYAGRWGTQELRGRSLGDEVVNITFDFFCASVGDAWGRDIAGWFDPNVKQSWTDDKGHINIPKAIDAAIKSTTRYITYNGGEDWAVAIPYAYFMKGQRALINRASPGFAYDVDRQLNGGSFKLKDHKVVGNYQLEGMLDLQSRFTFYNIGTLMYREAYDYLAYKMAGKADNLYGAPDQEKNQSLLGKAGDILKWTARSVIKGLIIMTPSVPFFWITRSPQSKYKGAFIDPEKGILGGVGAENKPLYAFLRPKDSNMPMGYMQYTNEPKASRPGNFDSYNLVPHGTLNDFNPGFAQPHPTGMGRNNFDPYSPNLNRMDSVLNPIGKANYHFASTLDEAGAWADKNLGRTGDNIKEFLGVPHNNERKFQNLTRPMLYAATSYTPYMIAKAEFANLWDNGKMDMAAERLIDGAAKFNWGEFKAGASEIWHTILQKPLADPKREAEGRHRMEIDTTPADIFTKTQVQMEEEVRQSHLAAEKKAHGQSLPKTDDLSWQERTISKPKGGDGASLEDKYKTVKPTPKPVTMAEREEMRKALQELDPPTNAIN